MVTTALDQFKKNNNNNKTKNKLYKRDCQLKKRRRENRRIPTKEITKHTQVKQAKNYRIRQRGLEIRLRGGRRREDQYEVTKKIK